MLYRKLGKTNENISILGLGNEIPINESENIFKYAIDNGVNFIETSNNSQIGEFLKENDYRDEILIQAKLDSKNFKNDLNEKLRKLNTDYIDIYQIRLTGPDFNELKELNLLDFLDNILSNGTVKHLGFEDYMEMDYLVEILDDYPKFEIVTSQMSYIDEHYKAGTQGLEHLKNLNLGSIVKNPLRNNCLIENIPIEIKELFDYSDIKRTPLEWALQYIWNRDDVHCLINNIKSLENLKEHIEVASRSYVNSFSENDCEIIRAVAIEYWQHKGNMCDICNHCLPCPQGVNIPYCFREYNVAKMLNNPQASAKYYFELLEDGTRADSCTLCEECEHLCPQMINIAEELQKVNECFEGD